MEQPARILIVDDEKNIRFILARSLKHENYLIDMAADGGEALARLSRQAYDLLLLDLQMKTIGGLEVLRAAKDQDAEVVVIILTAHGSLESAIEALRLGAFDYLLKPATPAAIRQRVRDGLKHRQQALQRSRLLSQIDGLRQMLQEIDSKSAELAPPTTEKRFLLSGSLTMDLHHRTATLEERLLDLTTTEFDLLSCLVHAAPEPLSPRALLNCALGYDEEPVEARDIIKWHIHHLRRKIEPDPAKPLHIKTVRYKGYLWSTTE